MRDIGYRGDQAGGWTGELEAHLDLGLHGDAVLRQRFRHGATLLRAQVQYLADALEAPQEDPPRPGDTGEASEPLEEDRAVVENDGGARATEPGQRRVRVFSIDFPVAHDQMGIGEQRHTQREEVEEREWGTAKQEQPDVSKGGAPIQDAVGVSHEGRRGDPYHGQPYQPRHHPGQPAPSADGRGTCADILQR